MALNKMKKYFIMMGNHIVAIVVIMHMSGPQDIDTGSFSRQGCLLIIINRSRISRQSKQKGCETPKALSSITMLEESVALKIIKQNPLHSRRKTKRL